MSRLTIENYRLPAASLGPENPLPDLQRNKDAHANIPIDTATISPEESRYMGWGRVNGILPYTLRDNYNRVKRPRDFPAVVLENDLLRATFLPSLGARLASLYDKRAGRELLHKNPVFQPCNLALRNAWISGGVEWNCGIIGHTPFTVDPLFAERLTLSDGTPVARFYQYERVRRLIYRIEAALPEGSDRLLVRVRIDNAGQDETKVYWWSNIAVDEREDVRVVVPATRAFRYGYGGNLTKVEVPYHNGWDVSRTMQLPKAMDFFFDIPKCQRPFIAALGGDGWGLCQTSTDELRGRKLFVWGMGAGGRHWQEFLAAPGCAYIEIQAGLAHTQLEHLPLAGGATLSWLEAYGPLNADPALVQGEDWPKAAAAVDAALEKALPREALDNWHARMASELDGARGTPVSGADGWGALEAEMCGPDFRGGLRFPKRYGAAEREWKALLEGGALPCPDPLEPPKGYQVGDRWLKLLRESIASGAGAHWYAYYHLGVMLAYRNDVEGALAAFEKSLALAKSPWALRCVALIKKENGDLAGAAALYSEAVALVPQRNLALEALAALSAAGQYEALEKLAEALPVRVRSLGRAKALRIGALIELGDLKRAEKLLLGGIELTDVREGEVSLTDLWFRLAAAKRARAEGLPVSEALMARVTLECPPPKGLDFRMH